MRNTVLIGWQIQKAAAVNRFIYRLQHLPLVGKKVPSSLYRASEIKSLFTVLALIASVVGGLLKKAIYVAALLYFPARLAGDLLFPGETALPGSAVFWLFACFNLLAGSFVNSTVLEVNEDKYVLLNLMRADARVYCLQQMALKLGRDTLYFLPPLWGGLCLLGKLPFWPVVSLLIELAAFRLIGEAAGLWLYDKKQFNIGHNGKVWLWILAGSLPAAAVLIWLCRDIPAVWTVGTHPLTACAAVLVSLPALRYLLRFPRYTYVARSTVTYAVVVQGRLAVEEMGKSGSAVDEKSFSSESLRSHKFEHLKGYEYLNALFFARNKRQYRLLWRIKMIMIGSLSVVACVAVLFFFKDKELSLSGIMPGLVFILYLMCSGQRVCKSLFFNCDICLLKYGFYRQGDALLQNFRIRLRRLVWMDMLPALLLCGGIVAFVLCSGQTQHLAAYIPMLVTIPLLSIFFDMYQLLLYYIFQPFLEGGGQKSLGYSLCSGLIYMAAYVCLQVRTASVWFTVGVMALTLVFIPVSFLLIYRLAPRCFRLK